MSTLFYPVQCFIAFERLQGRSGSRAPADARSVSDSWLSCLFYLFCSVNLVRIFFTWTLNC